MGKSFMQTFESTWTDSRALQINSAQFAPNLSVFIAA